MKVPAYLDMFGADDYCLFTPDVVRLWFKGWRTEDFQIEEFSAPGDTLKRFATVCSGQVILDSSIDFFDVDSRSKALGDKLPSFECSLMLL